MQDHKAQMISRVSLNILTALLTATAGISLFIPTSHRESVGDSASQQQAKLKRELRPAARAHDEAARVSFKKRAAELEQTRVPGKPLDVTAFAKEWAKRDPAGALTWAKDLKGLKERSDAIVAIMASATDARAVAMAIEDLKINLAQVDFNTNMSALRRFSVLLTDQVGHEEALEWVSRNVKGDIASQQISYIIRTVADDDPIRAFDILEKKESNKIERNNKYLMFSRATSEQLKAIADDLLKNTSEPEKRILRELAISWIYESPDAFKAYLDTLPQGVTRGEMISAAAKSIAYENLEEALTLASKLNQDQQASILPTIYRSSAINYPLGVFAKIKAAGDPAMIEKLTPTIIQSSFLTGRFEEAGSIVKSLDEGTLRQEQMSTVAYTWAMRDTDKCGAWLGTLTPGPSYDAAVGSFVRAMAKKDIESARTWADTIGDATLREKTRSDLEKNR